MNQLARNQPPQDHNASCAELLGMAEQELAAFFGAVTELFRSEEAELSAEDWLNEFLSTKTLPASTREWRRITFRASTRLASRCSHATPVLVSTQLEQASY
jgi:hypothetical protein